MIQTRIRYEEPKMSVHTIIEEDIITLSGELQGIGNKENFEDLFNNGGIDPYAY